MADAVVLDPEQAPNVELLCVAGHVACVEARSLDDLVYCWGWHLLYRNDNWRKLVMHPDAFADAVDHLMVLLIEHEVNVVSCVYTGRGL